MTGLTTPGELGFVAHRFQRAGITVFVVAMPIRAISTFLPVPSPSTPFPGNRRVDPAHAKGFADYWMTNERWAAPPLLLDTTFSLSSLYDRRTVSRGSESGILHFPDGSNELLEILDGQHRILGWSIATELVESGLAAAHRQIETAHVLGDVGAGRSGRAALQRFEQLSSRLDAEFVTIEIFEGIELDEHRQFFSDIATNAKGITKSVMAAFDQRDLVNRVAAELAGSHPLIEGVVDFEKDRMAGASMNLISAKSLGDVIRAAAVGFDSRASQRREALLDPDSVKAVTTRFLDVLQDEIPGLAEVAAGGMSAAELRATSLVASATVQRCLAGAFRLVAVDGIEECRPAVNQDGEQVFRKLLRQLDGMWGFPLDPRWVETPYFQHAGIRAPSSRAQDLKGLTLLLAAWASDGVPLRSR